eukprot:s1084_g27.t1
MEPFESASVPGYEAVVGRALEVEVEGFNEEGRAVSFDAKGWQARQLQHTADMLDGVLYVDRMETRSFRRDTVEEDLPEGVPYGVKAKASRAASRPLSWTRGPYFQYEVLMQFQNAFEISTNVPKWFQIPVEVSHAMAVEKEEIELQLDLEDDEVDSLDPEIFNLMARVEAALETKKRRREVEAEGLAQRDGLREEKHRKTLEHWERQFQLASLLAASVPTRES